MLPNDTQLMKRLKEIEMELAAIKREKELILSELGITEEAKATLSLEEEAYLKTMETLYDQEMVKRERIRTRSQKPLPPWALFCR